MRWVLDRLRGLAFGYREYNQSAVGLANNKKRLAWQLNQTLNEFFALAHLVSEPHFRLIFKMKVLIIFHFQIQPAIPLGPFLRRAED